MKKRACTLRVVSALLASLLLLTILALGATWWHRPPRTLSQYLHQHVPAATHMLDARGSFASQTQGGYRTTSSSASVSATTPAHAAGDFEVVAGGRSSVHVRLPEAAPSPAVVDARAVVYRDAYPDVDIVALTDPSYFELAFVVRDAPAPPLALEVDLLEGERLRREPGTGAVLVGADGRPPRVRIARPVAFDRRGTRAVGDYHAQGERLALVLPWERLEAPVVVDPKFALPLWSIVSDDRAPSARVYDPTSLSQETSAALDTARNRWVLVRPARSQQLEDTVFPFGIASRDVQPDDARPAGGSLVTQDAWNEWQRGVDARSETWEWDGSAWTLTDDTSLPGLVDPAMAYDEARSRMVLYGGAAPHWHCSVTVGGYWCDSDDRLDRTFEYDGHGWTARAIVGSPEPRLRAAMAWDPDRQAVVMFGGRQMDVRFRHDVDPHGPAHPDSMAEGLVADTWMFDGSQWVRIPTGNPPPAREGAQLVHDRQRGRMVLVGGRTAKQSAQQSDALSIWELDDIDWVERVAAGDPALPEEIRNRRSMSAFWNPVRARISLFGGQEQKRATCTLTDAQLAAQLAATQSDPVAREALGATGCLGGVIHDLWEWDGASLQQVTQVAFGGMVDGRAVYRQLTGASPWVAAGSAGGTDAGARATGNPMLPWRYDDREQHFELRTALERAFKPAQGSPLPGGGGTALGAGGGTLEFASPPIAPSTRARVAFDTAHDRVTMMTPGDGAMLSYDGAAWQSLGNADAPFASGPNDFFAATWDSARGQILLFDPTTGQTWTRTEQGAWSRAQPASHPPAWSHPRTMRTEADAPDRATPCMPEENPTECNHRALWTPKGFGARFHHIALELPRMAFDRARGKAMMLYANRLWQWDGGSWTESPLPAPLTSCRAATLMSYDGARERTVAFGCTVPSQTWEHDGSGWSGPYAGPHEALVDRDSGPALTAMLGYYTWWKGTLQLAWAHPNAATETPDGIATFDADGTLRTWDGTSWVPAGYECVRGPSLALSLPSRNGHWWGEDFLPACLFPPSVFEPASRQLVSLRDGYAGMAVLDLDADPASRTWSALPATTAYFNGLSWIHTSLVNPYPLELMSPEHVYLLSQTDASSRVYHDDISRPLWVPQVPRAELTLQNLWWPYRVLSDTTSGRSFVLTHRGMLWELGFEQAKGLGQVCQSDRDCAQGICGAEGVCCNRQFCGNTPCTTCLGAVAGTCEPVYGPIAKDVDGNPCTSQSCVAGVGVVFQPLAQGSACADGNACNGTETCDGQGQCRAGTAPELDDENPCTADACDAVAGVTHTPLAAGTSCSDNDVCNGTETCDAQGTCVAGAPLPIDDGDPCTSDVCNPQTGVSHVLVAAGSACTDGAGRAGTCKSGGYCVPTSDPAHEDGNPCTYDYEAGPVYHDVLAGLPCADGDLCNGDEFCSVTGECVAGTPLVVDDGDPATLDMCDWEVGVVHKVPPAIDRTLPTRIAVTNAFLYQAPDALQIGVDANALDEDRVATVHGEVRTRDGAPLEGVRVTIHDRAELGRTTTRPDGKFDMVVAGGGPLTVRYDKRGYLPVDRLVETHWRRSSYPGEVVMIPVDEQVTQVVANHPIEQVVLGPVESDEDGPRQPVVVFAPDTTATLRFADGSTRELESVHVRATEYTVGAPGPAAMPATLPPQTGYAYALELSADEVMAAGAAAVTFGRPVRLYVDNFLDIRAGAAVPIGTYDRPSGRWRAVVTGLVLDIVDVAGGVAHVDIDGDGAADEQSALSDRGIGASELELLGALYVSGQSLWRMEVEHFSPQVCGWAFGPPKCSLGPGGRNECDGTRDHLPEPHRQGGPSLVSGQAVAGAGPYLAYDSGRMAGDLRTNRVRIPLVPTPLPTGVQAIRAQFAVAGRAGAGRVPLGVSGPHSFAFDGEDISSGYDSSSGELTFDWDGKDRFGNKVQGERTFHVQVGYEYECEYRESGAFGGTGTDNIVSVNTKDGCQATLWRTSHANIGAWDPVPAGLGGFTVSDNSTLDPDSMTVYLGTGQSRDISQTFAAVQVFAGSLDSGMSADLLPAKESLLFGITAIVPSPDGSICVADAGNHRIVRIRTDGLLETIWTGIDATALALGPDGSLYCAEARRVWRMAPDGVIASVAGTGESCTHDTTAQCWSEISGYSTCIGPQDQWRCGDDGPAVEARFNNIVALAVDSHFNVYIGDNDTYQVRQVQPDGNIRRIAGPHGIDTELWWDTWLSTETKLAQVWSLAGTSDGAVFAMEAWDSPWSYGRLLRLAADGSTTVVVNVERDRCEWPWTEDTGDGAFATNGCLHFGGKIAVAPDGTIYTQESGSIRRIRGNVITTAVERSMWHFGESCNPAVVDYLAIHRPIAVDDAGSLYWVNGCSNQRIMKLPAGVEDDGDELRVVSADASVVDVFAPNGIQLRTEHARSGALLMSYEYEENRLSAMQDAWGNRLTLQRDSDGNAQRLVNTYGDETVIARDSSGYTSTIENPAGETESMGWYPAGLQATAGNPLGGSVAHFDANGALTKVTDAALGYVTVAHEVEGQTQTVRLETRMQRKAEVQVTELEDRTVQSVAKGPDGLITTTVALRDGRWTTEHPNGMQVSGGLKDDPQYGKAARYAGSLTVQTPEGLRQVVDIERTVSYGDPAAPSALPQIVSQTVTVNAKTAASAWDVRTGLISVTTPEGRQSFAQIDSVGQLLSVSPPAVLPTRLYYDGSGRIEFLGHGLRDLHFEYDAHGNLFKVRDHDDPSRVYVQYNRSPVGRPDTILLGGIDLLDVHIDQNGNLRTVTPPGQLPHSMEYTGGLLPDNYTAPQPFPEAPEDPFETEYGYNDDHQLTTVTPPSGTPLVLNYDETTGRLTSVATPQRLVTLTYEPSTGMVGSLTASDGFALGFDYDGALVRTQTLSGAVAGHVDWEYYPDFSLYREAVGGNVVTYRYDDDGIATQAGAMALTPEQLSGRLAATTLEQASDTYDYNEYGEVRSYDFKLDTTSLYTASYSHDALGRIDTATETIGGATQKLKYRYHRRGWLEGIDDITIEGQQTQVAQWGYDNNGNRQGEGRLYDQQDRLAYDSSYTYTYDRNGTLQTRTSKQHNEVTTYTYELGGALLRVERPGMTVEYLIDPMGRRVGKTRNGGRQWGLVYRSALQPAAMLDADGKQTARFVYALGRNVPDYMVRADGVYRIVTDLRGSVRLVVKLSDDTIAQRMDYDAWGVVQNDTNPGFQPFGYGGGIYDPDTGLVRFGARDYDAKTGRWTAKDPIGFGGGDTNLYNYAGGDPINGVDPSGLMPAGGYTPCYTCGMSSEESESFRRAQVTGGAYAAVGLGAIWASPRVPSYVWRGMAVALVIQIQDPDDFVGQLEAGLIAFGGLRGKGGAARGGSSACFVGNTPVMTRPGATPIAEVQPGDEVLSYNDNDGRWEWRRVEHLFVHSYEGTLVKIQSASGEITSTANHPFCVRAGTALWTRPIPSDMPSEPNSCGDGGRWVQAEDLVAGDLLVRGTGGVVQATSVETTSASARVYNLQVEGTHTYTVGDGEILVHNKAYPFSPGQRLLAWNKTAGDAARDAVANEFRMWGHYVRTEVRSPTLLGVRRHDAVVWESLDAFKRGASPIANLEVKLGSSRYWLHQRVLDAYIERLSGVPTYLVRVPR